MSLDVLRIHREYFSLLGLRQYFDGAEPKIGSCLIGDRCKSTNETQRPKPLHCRYRESVPHLFILVGYDTSGQSDTAYWDLRGSKHHIIHSTNPQDNILY